MAFGMYDSGSQPGFLAALSLSGRQPPRQAAKMASTAIVVPYPVVPHGNQEVVRVLLGRRRWLALSKGPKPARERGGERAGKRILINGRHTQAFFWALLEASLS